MTRFMKPGVAVAVRSTVHHATPNPSWFHTTHRTELRLCCTHHYLWHGTWTTGTVCPVKPLTALLVLVFKRYVLGILHYIHANSYIKLIVPCHIITQNSNLHYVMLTTLVLFPHATVLWIQVLVNYGTHQYSDQMFITSSECDISIFCECV